MACLILEGFDTYDTGNYEGKWALQNGTIQAGGRKGTKGLWHWDAIRATYSTANNPATIIVGFALKVSSAGDWEILELRDGQIISDRRVANRHLAKDGLEK